MTKDEALKLALDAIETYSPDYMHGLPKKHYTKTIKKALANVATIDATLQALRNQTQDRSSLMSDAPTKLLAIPDVLERAGWVRKKEWAGLTDEEMEQCYESVGSPINDWALGQAIEAKLKEKNG